MLLGHRKDKIPPLTTTLVDFKGVMLSEINQRQIPYHLTYMGNLEKKQKWKQEAQLIHAESAPWGLPEAGDREWQKWVAG